MVAWESGVRAKVVGLNSTVNELQEGDVPKDDFFETLQNRLDSRVWAVRLVCFLRCYFGFVLFVQPLTVAPDIVPCVGPVLGDLAGGVLKFAALWVALATAIVITGLCWLWFRPVLGLVLLAIAALFAYAAVRLRRRAAATKRTQHGARLHDAPACAGFATQYQASDAAVAPMGQLHPGMAAVPMVQPGMVGQPVAQPMMGQPGMVGQPLGQPMMGQPGMVGQPMGQPGMMGQPMGQPMMGQPGMVGQPMGQPIMGQPGMVAVPMAPAAQRRTHLRMYQTPICPCF